jgi:hypothetical protein
MIQLCWIQSHTFHTGTAGVKHLVSRSSLEKCRYFLAAELVFKKVPIGKFDLFLRKKRFRFQAGISACPTIKIHFIGHVFPLSPENIW